MKKITKMLVLALALVAALSLGAGSTAEAAKKATVSKVKAVDKVTGKSTITLTKGKKATLKVTVSGKNLKAKNKKVSYKTSNKKIATVNSKGVITAKKKTGSAKITVTSKTNKKKKATVKVKVVAGKVTKVKLNKTKLSLQAGKTSTLKATVSTKGKKPNKTIKWISSKTSVATVSSKGKVTAKNAGTTTITAKATDGTGKKATCKVTVTAKPAPTPDPEPTPEPKKETYTILTPQAEVTNINITVDFKNAADLQGDIDKAAQLAGVKDGEDIEIRDADYKVYKAVMKDGHVCIGDQTVAQKLGNQKTVSVHLTVAGNKLTTALLFVPKSVDKITIDKEVEFTDFNVTATGGSFKMDGQEFSYVVGSNNTIEIKGDYELLFAEKISTYVQITTVEREVQ